MTRLLTRRCGPGTVAPRGDRSGPFPEIWSRIHPLERFGSRFGSSWPVVRRALRLPSRRARRWWIAAAGAWVAGALGGVAPAAFVGDPSPGLAASAVLGLVTVAFLSPLLVTPVMATLIADDDRTQLASALHTAGVNAPVRLVARTVTTAEASLALLTVGALAGVVSGLGSGLRSSDGFASGLRSAPALSGVVAAATVLVVGWVLAVLVATAAVTPVRSLLVLVVSFLVTGVVASFVYFVPALRPVFWCMPWAALWPFDVESFSSAQFAASIPVVVRLASGGAWLAILAGLALRRLVVDPYPTATEPGAGRRSSRDQ